MLFFNQMQSYIQSQGIVPFAEPEVAPSTARVSTKGSYIDPSGQDLDMTTSDRHGLYIDDNPSCLVLLTRWQVYQIITSSKVLGSGPAGFYTAEKVKLYSLRFKFENGYEGNVYVYDEDTIVGYFYGRTGHMTFRCKDCPKKGSPNPFMTNTKGPQKIWVPKKRIFPITNILDNRKQMLVMVPKQWLLTTHDERKVYVPMPDSISWWNNHFQRE